MAEPMIAFENLSKSYGEIQAVRGVHLRVQPEEFFGLLGPNGAGKTTTLSMLTGLVAPSGGKITIKGVDLETRAMEAKAKMGFVPQSLAFYPSLTARENLSFFGGIYGLRGRHLRERISQSLETVSLLDRGDQVVNRFSHGMKRRLNIAIGFLHAPEVLILDEPTVGIDTQSRTAILECLQALNRSGVTILYTTHYMEEAQHLCHRVAIMDQGSVIALDRPSALVDALGKGILRLEFGGPLDPGLLNRMASMGRVRFVDSLKRKVHLQTENTDSVLKQVIGLPENAIAPLKSVSILEPNLETVFIHLTGRDLRD